MMIRVEKCVAFGMKKVRAKSVQYQPEIFIKSQQVPGVRTDSSFKCLSKYFGFQMSNSWTSLYRLI